MSEFRPKVLARGTVCLPGDACAVTALWRSAILAPHGFCTQVTFYLQVSAGAPSRMLATMESWLGTHSILLVKSELFKHKRMQEVWQIEP